MKYLQGLLAVSLFLVGAAQAHVIYDSARERKIPIEITYPVESGRCTLEHKCPVAFLSAGYGVSHAQYSFLSKTLNNLDYMVITVGHELPRDPPLSLKGNLYKTRSENWIRGANTLDFLKRELEPSYPNYDFDALLLVGHSNGGDISVWLANEGKPYVKSIITLDHRRVPLPRTKNIKVLSIRGSDYPADNGVLPTDEESLVDNICVIKIPESKHNDMFDQGPDWLKTKIAGLVEDFVGGTACGN